MLRKYLVNQMMASQPESGGQMPDTERLNLEDYHRILQESYGAIAADIAKLRAEVANASDRNAMVRVKTMDINYQIPTGPWRSVVISRPSYAEAFLNYGGFTDIKITFDNTVSGYIAYQGITTFPFFDFSTFLCHIGGQFTTGWSMDVFFTTRLYEFMPWTGY